MRKTLYFIFLALIVIYPAIASTGRTITVTDMAGRKVQAPFDPDRIVCLGPGALRLIVYLNAEDKVAGVEKMEKINPQGRPYWIANPELAELPSCGPGGPASINKKPDLEAILSVKPDVIFATYMEASLANEVQKILGIPVVVLSCGNFSTFDTVVYEALQFAGKILNREKRANDVVNFIESLRKDLNERTAGISKNRRPRVYVGGIGYRGSQGIESTEQSYIPFEWTNAGNVAEKVETSIGSHVFMDKERLLKLNPEVIFIDGGGLALIKEDYRKKSKYYETLKAFSERQVYILLPFNFYNTNIGTALADAYAIGKILYPDRFKDVDMEKKTDEIYSFLVGAPVYEQMKKDFAPIGGRAEFLN